MKRVAILCGGPSAEHEISCISAGGVLSAIDRTLFEPVLIGITHNGEWMLLPHDYPLQISGKKLPRIQGNFPIVTRTAAGFSADGKDLDIDIVFGVLHGAYGEDGQLQRELDALKIPYVGSGASASELAMDKAESKKAFAGVGLAIAPGISFTAEEWKRNSVSILASASDLSLPLFVKSARGGSSRGTVMVKDLSLISDAVEEALSFDSKVIIESGIKGSEVECAVLEIDGKPFASTPGRVWIDPRFDFYDFEAKYLDGATRVDIPAPFDSLVLKSLRDKAVQAFLAIGCRGLARVDFFVTPTNEIIINEINTMPGFTPTSAFPKMMAASGVSYTRVITELLQSALKV